jgi:hypothetical protein
MHERCSTSQGLFASYRHGIAHSASTAHSCVAGCRCYCHACRIDSNTGAERTNGGPEWEFAPH